MAIKNVQTSQYCVHFDIVIIEIYSGSRTRVTQRRKVTGASTRGEFMEQLLNEMLTNTNANTLIDQLMDEIRAIDGNLDALRWEAEREKTEFEMIAWAITMAAQTAASFVPGMGPLLSSANLIAVKSNDARVDGRLFGATVPLERAKAKAIASASQAATDRREAGRAATERAGPWETIQTTTIDSWVGTITWTQPVAICWRRYCGIDVVRSISIGEWRTGEGVSGTPSGGN